MFTQKKPDMSHIVIPPINTNTISLKKGGMIRLLSSTDNESVWLNEFMVIKIYLAKKEILHISNMQLSRKDKIIKMIQSIVDHFKMGEQKFYEQLMIKAPGTYTSVMDFIKGGFASLLHNQILYGYVEKMISMNNCTKSIADKITCKILDIITDDNVVLFNYEEILENQILTETVSDRVKCLS